VAKEKDISEMMAKTCSGGAPPGQVCPGDLGKYMEAAMKLLMADASLIASAVNAPGISLRTLVRMASDPSAPGDIERRKERIQQERAQLWQKAQACRRKLVNFALWKSKTADGLQALFNKAGAAKGFVGAVNEQHRLFVLSADLVTETGAAPWCMASQPGAVFEEMLKFAKAQTGPVDIIVAFDGRMRDGRQASEGAVAPPGRTGSGSFTAFVVLYNKGAAVCRFGRRRVFLGLRNQEMGYARLAVARTSVSTKERKDQYAVEATTHDGNYINVPFPPVSCLARISPQEKAHIFDITGGASPAGWSRSGVPLFWQESKPACLWSALLENLDIKCVVDMTPGSGTLAQACMVAGIQYCGFVMNETHLSWLSNVVDRFALTLIVQKGHVLYVEDLMSHIKEHFGDILDEMNAPEVEEEEDEGEEQG